MKVLKSLSKAERVTLVLLLLAAVLNFFPTIMVTVIPSGMLGPENSVPYEMQQNSVGMLYLIVPAGILLCFSKKWLRVLGMIFSGLAFFLQLLLTHLLNGIKESLVVCDAPSYTYALSVLGWICVAIEATAFVLQICCIKRRFHSAPVMGQTPTYEEVSLGFETPTPYENPENNDSEEMTL